MVRVACLLLGYIFGLFQTAYFYGKANGIDIRQYGSGNSGTTNALRVLGTKAGLIVFAGDCLKCILAIILIRILFGSSHPDTIYLLSLYGAFGTILGHNFPFYMGFKGGKGIAATAGFVLAFHPYFIVVGAVLFFTIFFTTHYVSLGSLVVYSAILIEMIVCTTMGILGNLTTGQCIEMNVVTALMTILAFWMHRTNIVRLLHKEERKTYLLKKNKVDVEKKEK